MKPTDLAFARWLQGNYPQLFTAMAAQAMSPTDTGLSGWGDIFSSLGTGLAKAGSAVVQYGGQALTAVASYIGSESGQKSLGQLASLYVASQGNKDAIAVQLANQQAGKPPAPIVATVEPVTGTTTAVYAPPGQPAQALTPSIASSLLTTARKPDSLMPLGIAAGVVAVALLMRRRA